MNVKKSKTGDYFFAFIVYEKGQNGDHVVEKLNGTDVLGKSMKVQLQNDQKRRKDSDLGCYTCGRKGHFARECRSGRDNHRDTRGYRRRSRSDSRSEDHRMKRKHRRSPSESSQRSRRKRKDKSKKHRKSKKQKKDKKYRRYSSSRSYS